MKALNHLGRLLREVAAFAWHNKAWWIVPIVIVLLLLSALIFVGTAAAPLLYPLF